MSLFRPHSASTNMISSNRSLYLTMGVCLVAGCSDFVPAGEDTDRFGGQVDSARGEPTVFVQRWRLDSPPVLALGGSTAVGQRTFYEIVGLYRLSDGRIAVADGGSSELRLFERGGEHASTWGGSGDGPGEFRELSWMEGVEPDTLLMWDAAGNRITVFRPDEGLLSVEAFAGRGEVIGRFDDGSWLLRRRVSTGGIPSRSGLRRDSADYVRVLRDGEATPLLRLAGEGLYFVMGGDGFAVHPSPFVVEPLVATVGDDLLVVDPETGDFIRYDDAGRERETWRHEPARRTLGEVDRSRWLDRVLSQADHPAERTQARRVLEDMEIPETAPLFDAIVVGSQYIWVRRFVMPGDETASWDIMSHTGRWLATLAAPANLRIRQVGSDFILAVARDEFDAESVRLYNLRRVPIVQAPPEAVHYWFTGVVTRPPPVRRVPDFDGAWNH